MLEVLTTKLIVSNQNCWQDDDGWSTALTFVMFPENTNVRYRARVKKSVRRSHVGTRRDHKYNI